MLIFKQNTSEKGSALIYILIGIALIGTLTMTMLNSGSQSSKSQKSFQLAHALEGQIKLIESTIQECIINYPDGDPTVNDGVVTDAGYIAPYPVTPNSAHFTGSTAGVAPDWHFKYLGCPGNPGIDNNHSPLFSAAQGHYAPQIPVPMGGWGYYNRAGMVAGEAVDGVFIQASTSNQDSYIQDALLRLSSKYTDCKMDYIIGNGTNGCVDGNFCLRYWLVRNSPC